MRAREEELCLEVAITIGYANHFFLCDCFTSSYLLCAHVKCTFNGTSSHFVHNLLHSTEEMKTMLNTKKKKKTARTYRILNVTDVCQQGSKFHLIFRISLYNCALTIAVYCVIMLSAYVQFIECI